jgi:hypothetical protein
MAVVCPLQEFRTKIAFSFSLGLVLARHGAAASCSMVHEEGRASSLDTLFEASLYRVLAECLPSRESNVFHEGLLELGNSEFMMASECYCPGCRRRRERN